MLEYDRIDISEGTDIKKCKETSRECSLCKLYYFLNKNFSYGPYLCNGCYDMSLKAISMQIHHQLQYARGSFGLTTQAQASMYVSNLIQFIISCSTHGAPLT